MEAASKHGLPSEVGIIEFKVTATNCGKSPLNLIGKYGKEIGNEEKEGFVIYFNQSIGDTVASGSKAQDTVAL